MGLMRLGFGLSAAVCCLLWSGVVAAGCITPPGYVVWQYPAQGEEDVPTNASIWVHASGTSVSVTLDGVPLARVPGQPRFEAPVLEANTTYTLEIEARGEPAVVKTTSFTTGSSAWSGTLEEPTLNSFEYNEAEQLAGHLPILATLNTCYDTGPPPFARFDLTSNAFMLQVGATIETRRGPRSIASQVWPSMFGPVVIQGFAVPSEGCFDVTSFAVTGEQRLSQVCVPEEVTDDISGDEGSGAIHSTRADDKDSEGSGCAVLSSTSAPTLTLLWMMGVACLVARRRRRDPRR